MVYSVQEAAAPDGPVLIGYAAHASLLRARLRALQPGNARVLRVVAVIQHAGRDAYRDLRRDLAEHHVLGDWFRLGATVRVFLARWLVSDDYDPGEEVRVHLRQRIENRRTGGDEPATPKQSGGFRPTPWGHLVREQPGEAKQRILAAFLATAGNAVRAAEMLDVSHRSLCRYVQRLNLAAEIERIRA